MPDGNEAQARIIARQLFDIWKAENGEQRSRWYASAPAWMALFISVAGAIWMGGVQAQVVDSNSRRIDALEKNEREDASGQQQMLQRMASMEAKIDLLIEERAKR